jgi:hypothetical protein
MCCVVLCRYRSLRRADHSSREVLPCVCMCVIKKPRKGRPKIHPGLQAHVNVMLSPQHTAFELESGIENTRASLVSNFKQWLTYMNLKRATSAPAYVHTIPNTTDTTKSESRCHDVHRIFLRPHSYKNNDIFGSIISSGSPPSLSWSRARPTASTRFHLFNCYFFYDSLAFVGVRTVHA